jgi:hypothetical protein
MLWQLEQSSGYTFPGFTSAIFQWSDEPLQGQETEYRARVGE